MILNKPLKSQHIVLATILFTVSFGLYVRFLASTETIVENPIRADALEYYWSAQNLKFHGVFSRQVTKGELKESAIKPDAVRSPGYPIFIAIWADGDEHSTLKRVITAQTIVQVLSFGFLSFAFYKELGRIWCIPVLAFLWTFPHFVSINTYLLSESLFVSILAISVFLFWVAKNSEKHSLLFYSAAGLSIGLAALVRPVLEYLPLFLLVSLLFIDRRFFKSLILVSFFGLIPVLIWKIRNILSIGALSDPTLLVNGLYHGHFPNFMYEDKLLSHGFPYLFDPRSAEVGTDVTSTIQLIWSRVVEEPFKYLQWYLFGKIYYLWRWGILAGQGDIYIYPVIYSPYFDQWGLQVSSMVHRLLHLIWVPLAIFSTACLLMKQLFNKSYNILFVFLAIIILYVSLVHMILAPFPRYGIPFKLILFPILIVSIRDFIEWIKPAWKSR